MRPSQTYWYRGYSLPQLYDRDSFTRNKRAHPCERSYYWPPLGGMDARYNERRISRSWKEDEARCGRRERIEAKKKLGHHMRRMWMAMGWYSFEWTTCGYPVLGPSRGEWKDYPRSKGMRQRIARQAKRTRNCMTCKGKGWISGKQCRGCLPKNQWYDPPKVGAL